MSDAGRDEVLAGDIPMEEPGPDVIEQRAPADLDEGLGELEPVLPELEVSEADAWEQVLPVEGEATGGRPLRVATDPEVSEADAWEQAQVVDRSDDYERGGSE